MKDYDAGEANLQIQEAKGDAHNEQSTGKPQNRREDAQDPFRSALPFEPLSDSLDCHIEQTASNRPAAFFPSYQEIDQSAEGVQENNHENPHDPLRTGQPFVL